MTFSARGFSRSNGLADLRILIYPRVSRRAPIIIVQAHLLSPSPPPPALHYIATVLLVAGLLLAGRKLSGIKLLSLLAGVETYIYVYPRETHLSSGNKSARLFEKSASNLGRNPRLRPRGRAVKRKND